MIIDFQFKDIAEIAAKVVVLKDERIRYWNDIVSNTNTVIAVSKIMGIKDQYKAIVRWMVVDQITKGGYTEEDARLGEICRNEIEKCDKALADCICKEITDKVLSKVAEILSNRL